MMSAGDNLKTQPGLRPFQFFVKRWFIFTAIFGLALAFPQFALFAPVIVCLSILVAAISLVVAAGYYLLASDPQPIIDATWRNLRDLLAFNFFVLLYIVYGFTKVNFDLG
jgi:hypothetical protein